MTYMLDTNICIYIIEQIPNVLSAFLTKKADGATISAITLAELEFGVYNSDAQERNLFKLLLFLQLVDILQFDGSAAVTYGGIRAELRRKGALIGPLDMLIAAHAKSKGLILVTNNVREFSRVEGLAWENWAE